MENPAQGLGQIIRHVEDAGDMFHDQLFLVGPFLDREPLCVDVFGSSGGPTFVDHVLHNLVGAGVGSGAASLECDIKFWVVGGL